MLQRYILSILLAAGGVKTLPGHSIEILLISQRPNDVEGAIEIGLFIGLLILSDFITKYSVVANFCKGNRRHG